MRAGKCESIFLIPEDKTADNFFVHVLSHTINGQKFNSFVGIFRSSSSIIPCKQFPFLTYLGRWKGLCSQSTLSVYWPIYEDVTLSLPLKVWNWILKSGRGLYFAEHSRFFFSDSLIFTLKYQLSEEICPSHRLVSEPKPLCILRYQR